MLRVPDVLRALHDLERKMVRTAKVVLGEFQLRLTAWPDRKADAWVVRADTDAEEHATEKFCLVRVDAAENLEPPHGNLDVIVWDYRRRLRWDHPLDLAHREVVYIGLLGLGQLLELLDVVQPAQNPFSVTARNDDAAPSPGEHAADVLCHLARGAFLELTRSGELGTMESRANVATEDDGDEDEDDDDDGGDEDGDDDDDEDDGDEDDECDGDGC